MNAAHEESGRSKRPRSTPSKPKGGAGRSLKGPVPQFDYRLTFDSSAEALLIVDAVGRLLDANRAACELTGYNKEELTRMTVEDLGAKTAQAATEWPSQSPPAAEIPNLWQALRRKDGSILRIESRRLIQQNGAAQVALRDCSRSEADVAAMQSAAQAFSAVIQFCHSAVITAGPDGRIASWNPAAVALFGHSVKDAVGMPIAELIPQSDRDAHEVGFRRHLAHSNDLRFGRSIVSRALRKDGSEVKVEVCVGVGRRGESQVFAAVVRDVSEHEQVVERLNDALQRLQFHIERMPLAYIVWDKDFQVVEWNPAAERIFGYAKSEAIGRQSYDLLVPPDVAGRVRGIWNDLLNGDTSSHSINDNVRKDGSRLTCEWFNTPLRDSAGRIHGVASMAMDVSERELMEVQIRQAQKLESLGVMAGGVAHDFNSSLTVILGNAELLRSTKDLPPRALEHLTMIEEAGMRANTLIKHLLAYARTGRHNPQTTDINAVIRAAVPFLQSSIGMKHEIQIDLADRLPPIQADVSQVEQILLNLCLNAQQAMTRGGSITVSTHETRLNARQAAHCVPHDAKPGTYAELRVRDTGCGMNEATLARIFDPFFTTKPDGHGLGLAAVLGILRQHGAVARVESTPKRGTTMHIFFPA